MKSYIAVVRHAGQEYTLSFPDLPGCVASGRSIEEARIKASHVIVAHLHDLIAAGEAIPVPSSLHDLVAKPELMPKDVDAIILAVRPNARSSS